MSKRERQTDAADALRTLATAEPPAGMEQRILRRMQEAECAAEATPHTKWQQWMVAGLACCVVVMAAMLPVWYSHPADPSHTGEPARRVERNEAMASGGALSGEAEPPLRLESKHSVRRTLHLSRRYEPHAQEVSFPPPPAPLTREEQLLVQVSKARTPAEAVLEQALLHTEPAQVPGERLPSLPHDVPGQPLPTLAAEAPGHPLPNFFDAMKTGDRP